jgi:hypothetical protein
MIDKEIQILKKEREEDYDMEDDYFYMDESNTEVLLDFFKFN